jgi:hypothetical protein
MGDNCLPDGQTDEQKRGHDAHIDADFLDAGHPAKEFIDPGPREHRADDEAGAENGERQRKQLQPTEGNVKEPLRLDDFRRR